MESQREPSNKITKTDVFKKRKNKVNQLVRPGQIRVLVAESNDDLRYLYKTYLDLLGLKAETVNSGEARLNHLFKNPNNYNFDTIIINTHLFDISGLDIAKEIHKNNPKQRIVIVSTSIREHLPKEQLDFAGIGCEYVLNIPFRFSYMLPLLNPDGNRHNN
ncbi:MAG: response regulator [Nitrosopumilus sp.]|nr:response regulator [Nitrosopumilus sp.]